MLSVKGCGLLVTLSTGIHLLHCTGSHVFLEQSIRARGSKTGVPGVMLLIGVGVSLIGVGVSLIGIGVFFIGVSVSLIGVRMFLISVGVFFIGVGMFLISVGALTCSLA